ncbi:hypothetical protein [Paracidovorax sp. MALMAid1276]|uniref:hypothetical protein n=1 Tax=Paracidovorax sp. MALMAid1276 TaxID=3411631 RepID=UPI003B9ACE19
MALQASARGDFVRVLPAQCQPVADAAPLPAELEPYRAAVRACPLARAPQPARVRLLSVFTDDFYKGLPADARWQNFPLPVLVDASGRCIGRLPHLFPVDPPQELTVHAGQWRNGIPHELRLHVLSPAVGGNHPLPSLRWQAPTQSYHANAPAASPNTPHTLPGDPSKDKTPCP